jgi:uncharacterized protein YoxC
MNLRQTPTIGGMNKRLYGSPIQFSLLTNELPDWIQVIRAGLFYDMRYGQIKITPEILISFVDNFNNNIRKVDLALDYSHDAEGPAAGWFEELETRENDTELWAKINWTETGKRRVQEKEFRYVSADFNLDYEDNETLRGHGPVLYGAGLTNRPLVKGMQPTTVLQELSESEVNHMDEQTKALVETVESLGNQFSELTKTLDTLVADQKGDKKASEDVKKAEDDKKDDMGEMKRKLEEMAKENKDLKAQVAKLTGEKQASEKEMQFQKLLSEGKAVPAQKDAFLADDMAKFAELAGEVNTDAAGTGDNPPHHDENLDSQDKVIALAEKKVQDSDGKLEFKDAMSAVLSENPELRKQIYG